jgi:N-acetylmuramoyl-L-alanine amidase
VTTQTWLTGAVAVLLVVQGPAAVAQLPAAPVVHGPLRIEVAHPAPGSAIAFGDSTFLYGSVGDGAATLTVAGQPVTVAPNGAWLAWIALPHDSALAVTLVAKHGSETVSSTLRFRRAGWLRHQRAWVDPTSLSPAGAVWLPDGEPLPLTVRAAPGAQMRLILPGGTMLRFTADSLPAMPGEAIRAFDRDERNLVALTQGDRYVATLRSAINPGANTLESNRPESRQAAPVLQVVLNGDTTRMPWPLSVTRVTNAGIAVSLDANPAHTPGVDGTTIGRAYPTGTYTWFFAPGTRTQVDMRIGDQVRLRLSHDAVAWVPLADVHPLPAASDVRDAVIGSPTLTTVGGITRLRIPSTLAVPVSVDESESGLTITLYHAVSNANWTRYPAGEQFVQLLTWNQVSEDRVTVSLAFARPLWGWRSRVDRTDLVFEFRAPPAINAARPLAGRRIVIDPGHPPAGACGPTALCEPEVNLAIANLVRAQLAAAGANVIMTRTTMRDVGLWPRVALADSVNADLLVSIHNNALPDGINPFTNNGTSTFFNHPLSLALARTVQSRLVAHLHLRDLGVARGDLALTRPTWYPAILTEGVHLLIPQQEAAMRSAAGQRLYATGVVEGIIAFLRAAAREKTPGK